MHIMLAYELFLNNKQSQTVPVKDEHPVKKIFYMNNKVTIDEKTIEEYGGEEPKNDDEGRIQNLLQMPFNTTGLALNLPDNRTGARSSNPYVEIYATLNKSNLELIIGKKDEDNYIKYTLNVEEEYAIKSDEAGSIILKRVKDYYVDSNTLFDEYVKSGIVNDKGMLNNDTYKKIINEFFDFVKKQELHTIKFKIRFRIFILPSDKPIEYRKVTPTSDKLKQEEFTDYFGNTSSYAQATTKTAKFLTYDDPAFSINCKQKSDFYKNLGIGNDSLKKIYIDVRQVFEISGFKWMFTDISNTDFKFEKTKKGFLHQIHHNYLKIKEDKGISKKPQMKILCIKSNKQKQEIFIDENLTMDKMSELFDDMGNIPHTCFEILIDETSQNTVWNTYIYAIKSFLTGHKIQKDYLVTFFTRILRQEIHKWIKTPNFTEQQEFFTKSDFCFKTLSIVNNDRTYMNSNEEYAENIGKIARAYIDFKLNGEEKDNSLSDILTYSKYDRERLRFIVSRIGRGINLSKIADKNKTDVTKKVSILQPDKEISDDASAKDYSYFFFKGYYTSTEVIA